MRLRITGANTSPSRQLTAEQARRIRWRERMWRQSIAALKRDNVEPCIHNVDTEVTANSSDEKTTSLDNKPRSAWEDFVSQRTTRSKDAWINRSTRSKGFFTDSFHRYNDTLMKQGRRTQIKRDGKMTTDLESSLNKCLEEEEKLQKDAVEDEEEKEEEEEEEDTVVDIPKADSLKVNMEPLPIKTQRKPQRSGKNSSTDISCTRSTRHKSTETMNNRLFNFGLDPSNVIQRKRCQDKTNAATRPSLNIRLARDELGSKVLPIHSFSANAKLNPLNSKVRLASTRVNTTCSLERKKTASLRQLVCSTSDSKTSKRPKREKSETIIRLKNVKMDSKRTCAKAILKSDPIPHSNPQSEMLTPNTIRKSKHGSLSVLMKSSLPPAPPNIKWKTSSMGHLVKEGVKELNGRCTFMDLLQYMRSVHTCASNALFVLHAVQVAVMKKMVFIYDNKFVTKEILKILEDKKNRDGKQKEVKRGNISERKRGSRYSYRILRNQLLKTE